MLVWLLPGGFRVKWRRASRTRIRVAFLRACDHKLNDAPTSRYMTGELALLLPTLQMQLISMSDDGALQLTCFSCDRVQAFRDGDVRFLICTDVAARGKLQFNSSDH